MGGIRPLLQTLKELEQGGIPGEILTTNYLNFSEPADTGVHTKGYIFKKEEVYRIIVGSSNMTSAALTSNKEWNAKIVSTEQGEVTRVLIEEFHQLWESDYALAYDDFIETYLERYRIIKRQRKIAGQERMPSFEKYRLQPNDMQVGFIRNLRKILAFGEERALLISATGDCVIIVTRRNRTDKQRLRAA